MGHEEHKRAAPREITVALITVSDTRDREEDKSGTVLRDLLLGAGHTVFDRFLVRDERDEIESRLAELLKVEEIDMIILTGGSGIAKRDVTIESVLPFVEKTIDGFGELFRYLSFVEIGSPAMLSRAMAGVAREKIIVCLPGSVKAVELAMNKLLLPEAGHLILEARK
jgi:molybdenum cofactor biosynthesis protein B